MATSVRITTLSDVQQDDKQSKQWREKTIWHSLRHVSRTMILCDAIVAHYVRNDLKTIHCNARQAKHWHGHWLRLNTRRLNATLLQPSTYATTINYEICDAQCKNRGPRPEIIAIRKRCAHGTRKCTDWLETINKKWCTKINGTIIDLDHFKIFYQTWTTT